jgi:hypothetical protein
MERSEGDMPLKNPVTLPGIDPGTVRLIAQRTEMGKRNISWGVKAVDAFWEPHSSGIFRVCPDLYKDCFTTVSFCSVLMICSINRESVKDI